MVELHDWTNRVGLESIGVYAIKVAEDLWLEWDLPFGEQDRATLYTDSLDAIWPLQAKAIEAAERGARGYRYWLKRVISANDHNVVHKYIVANAEQRARAVCLALLDKLNELEGA